MIRKGLAYSIPLLAVMFALSAYGWTATEPGAQLPVHWGLDGQPDRYGGRLEALFVMPAVMSGLVLLFTILPSIDPRGSNLRRSSTLYLTAWIGSMLLITGIHAATVMAATGMIARDGAGVMPQLVTGGVAVLFVIIGNFMGKARPNWFVGIRTPWTLSSDRSWDRTHRVTGRLMVLGGLSSFVAVFVLPPAAMVFMLLVCVLGPTLFGVVLSYIVWRNDPDRVTESPAEAD